MNELHQDSFLEVHGDGQMESKEIPAKAGMKPPPHNAVIAGDVDMHGPSPSAPSHIGVPSTPVIQVGREELELEASDRPAKQARTRDIMALSDTLSMKMKNSNFVSRMMTWKPWRTMTRTLHLMKCLKLQMVVQLDLKNSSMSTVCMNPGFQVKSCRDLMLLLIASR